MRWITTAKYRNSEINEGHIFVIGGVSLLLMLLYLNMWILLKIKTNKQDIPGIEKIGKVYSYVSGSLEIIGTIALIVFSIIGLLGGKEVGVITGYIIGSAIYLIFACLKIYGIRHVYPRTPDSSEGLIPRAIICYIRIDP